MRSPEVPGHLTPAKRDISTFPITDQAFEVMFGDGGRSALLRTFAILNIMRERDGKGRTPAMAAGVEARKWEIADLIALLPDAEVKPPSK